MGWFSKLFGSADVTPPFDELRAQTRRSGQSLSRQEARARLFADPRVNHLQARPMREQLAALADAPAPWDQAACARAHALLREALAAQGFLARPGSVEEIWLLEGYLDRLAQP